MALTECEAWMVVDAAGDYGVGRDKDKANEDYENEIGALSDAEGLRYVQVMLKVPMPVVITVEGEVLDTSEDKAVLAVKNQS
jgi:hypothetical protein